MTLAVQQSLFEIGSGAPMAASARWIEEVMLGDIAIVLCVIAVAFIGALMLTGRLPLSEGARVVIGCFVLLGAPLIAAGFMGVGRSAIEEPSPSPPPAPVEASRPDLPPANYDPYAGAAVGAK